MVKIKTADGGETKWDKGDLEEELESAGLSKKLAEELADRVEHKVVDGWTINQVKEETAVEFKRLKEDIERAYHRYLDYVGIRRETFPREEHIGEESPLESAREMTRTEIEYEPTGT